MNKDKNEAIDRYCTYFSTQIERISNLDGDSSRLYKKILYCSVIDALSRSVCPKKKPRERFTTLVRDFGRWSSHDRVSLPHVARLLDIIPPDPTFANLREFTRQRLACWKAPWGTITLEQDPQYVDIATYWPDDVELEVPLKKITLKSLTHLQLLYSHRNSLFHELREPGYGIEMDDDDEPYYHDLKTVSDPNVPDLESMELVYPVRFFQQLCLTLLKGLRKHFQREGFDPYGSYRFGSYWMEDLN